MALSNKTLKEVTEQYSHFKLAEGDCICTGLGFLLRESWLLENPRVTKITVIEKNVVVIHYCWTTMSGKRLTISPKT